MTDEERVEACTAQLLDACREAGLFLTGDLRISEQDAAMLLGLSCGHMKNMRSEGAAPAFHRIGIGGHRISYSVRDLATWIVSRREDWSNVI